jgi:hypothetical protein
MDEFGPTGKAVLAREFMLGLMERDRALALSRLGLLSQVLQRRALG